MQFHTLRRSAAAALLVALVAAGCTRQSGSEGAQGDTGVGAGPATTQGEPATPTTAAGTATSASGAGGSGGATNSSSAAPGGGAGDALDDGRHPVRIVALDTGNKTVRFDLVEFLQGAEAEKAAREDGAGEAYDFYIRNTNKRLRTLATAPSLTVVVNVLAAAETGSSTKDTKITFDKLASYPTGRLADAMFWLTVSHGKVIRIEEQYLP